jgi:cytochrome c553
MTRKVFLSLTLLMVGVTVVWAGDFNHQAHLGDYVPGTSCDTCHLADALSIVPDTKICLDCHDKEATTVPKQRATLLIALLVTRKNIAWNAINLDLPTRWASLETI